MSDVHSKHVRSKNMRAIKSKNTRPELQVRKFLHSKGLRYKLHDKSLLGQPDLVFPKYRTIIFINGCFWHGHKCQFFKWPKSNIEFWQNKINSNIKRDIRKSENLMLKGWNVITIWECSLRKPKSDVLEYLENIKKLIKKNV